MTQNPNYNNGYAGKIIDKMSVFTECDYIYPSLMLITSESWFYIGGQDSLSLAIS